jgi:hypothetical protein
LAQQPGDQMTRQDAVERSLEVLQEMRSASAEPSPELTAALAAAGLDLSVEDNGRCFSPNAGPQ